MKKLLFCAVQWIWGLPINLIGLVAFIFFAKLKRCEHEQFYNSTVTYVPGNWGGVSFGTFIFINSERNEAWRRDARIHEYGHTIQLLLLGPLWILAVAIPSFVWCNFKPCIKFRKRHDTSYYSFYCEAWADSLGQKYTGLELLRK